MRARYPERLRQPARTGREQANVVEPAPSAHDVEPSGRLERAHEHRSADSFLAAHDVRAPVDAVRPVDVEPSRRPEHRRVPRLPPAERVARRIGRLVRLRLDDHAADAVDEERPADELPRDVLRTAREERARRAQKSGSVSVGRAVAARTLRARRPRSPRSTRPSSAAAARRSARSSAPSSSAESPAS